MADSVSHRHLAQFKAKAGSLLAQLKLYEDAHFASNQKPNPNKKLA